MTEQPPTPPTPRTPRIPENYGLLPYGVNAPPPEPEPVDDEPVTRPGVVTAAAVVTWIFAGMALVGSGWILIAVNADRAAFEREIARENDLDRLGITADALARTFTIAGAVLALLSVGAVILALAVFRGSNPARVTLLVLSMATCVICLMLSFAVLPLAWLIAALAVAVLLSLGRTKWWTHRVR